MQYHFTYMWDLKTKQMDKQNKPINTWNKEVFATGVEGGGWVKWVKVIKGIYFHL